MAEWRRHYKAMWSDKKVLRMSRDARLLFCGLIDLSDDEGFYEGDPTALKAAIFPADEISVTDTLRLRNELVRIGVAKLHEVGDECFIQLPNFQRFQQTRKDTFRPSTIKSRIDLRGKPKRTRNGPVTDSLQTRDDSVTYTNKQTDKQTEQKSSAAPALDEPTRELSGHQKDIRDLTDLWQSHFHRDGKASPSPGFFGKVLVNCQRVGVSPAWLIEKMKPDHANAEAMILFFFKPGESLPGSDDERRANSFTVWQRRDSGGVLLGDVLRKQGMKP